MTFYGASKAGMSYFMRSWAKELPKDSRIQMGTLSPGMVATDFLEAAYDDPEEYVKGQKIFNILADKVETVTPWLVEKILRNTKNGAAISWLTSGKVLWRFATAGFTKRDLFSE